MIWMKFQILKTLGIKKITVFLQMMLYYKFNLVYPNILWHGSKICKKKDLLSPQWLRNVKTKKYSKWRPDLIFKKKYTITLI